MVEDKKVEDKKVEIEPVTTTAIVLGSAVLLGYMIGKLGTFSVYERFETANSILLAKLKLFKSTTYFKINDDMKYEYFMKVVFSKKMGKSYISIPEIIAVKKEYIPTFKKNIIEKTQFFSNMYQEFQHVLYRVPGYITDAKIIPSIIDSLRNQYIEQEQD